MKKLFLTTLFASFLVSFLFISCEEEIIMPQEIADKPTTTEVAPVKTTCNIFGVSSVNAGSTYTYMYTSNLSNPFVTWLVSSGITINSSTSTSVTVTYSSNFTSGTITALGQSSSNGLRCDEQFSVSAIVDPPLTCPSSSNLSITEAEPCLDFLVYLNNANDVASVDWYYSIGSYNNVYFGTTTNTNGSYSIYNALYLNSNNWENYFLVIKARARLTDGTQCPERTKSILLNGCNTFPGGPSL